MNKHETAGLFGIDGISGIIGINYGHINNTWLVSCDGGERYILQTVNSDVFTSPEEVMANIGRISRVFEKSPDDTVKIPEYLCTAYGLNYAEVEGTYYRAYRYAEEDDFLSAEKYAKAGYAFGAYMRKLSGKNVRLEETIRDFHSYSHYFSILTAADKSSPLKKIDRMVMRRLSSLRDTLEQVFTVDFPTRNVHNDAKISNVIIGRECTVIDLDTTMKGYAAVDYGDLIRSVCTRSELDFSLIRDITKGFADGLAGTLTEDEIYSLYYGILYVTGELAVRYLIDYISDAGYFKDKSSAACLSRANELLRQLSVFIASGDEITSIIYEVFRKREGR